MKPQTLQRIQDAWKKMCTLVTDRCSWCLPDLSRPHNIFSRDSAGNIHRGNCPWLMMDQAVQKSEMPACDRCGGTLSARAKTTGGVCFGCQAASVLPSTR